MSTGKVAGSPSYSDPRDGPAQRILTVGNMYPPHHAGGYEVMWQAAVTRARELGHQVRVLTSDYVASADLEETDADVHRTLRWYWDLDRYQFPRLGPLQRLGLELHNARELERQFREFKPDLVSWWSMGCMSLSLIERVRRRGVPATLVVHDDWLVYGPGFDQWLRMWRGRRNLLAPAAERCLRVPTSVDLSGAGRFLFNSQHTLRTAQKAGIQIPEAKVVPPGIEAPIQRALPAHSWRWRLLYLGRIDRQKGVDTAVEALAVLPDEATLQVWGTGDEEYVQEMKAQAERLGISGRVRFLGWAGTEERLAAYEDADVVVFPVRWEEPFGLVPIEAMSIGRPVVSTGRGGTSEFLCHGENALLFDADDPTALAEAVRRLAGDEALRQRLFAGGRKTAGHYTVERFADETVREILGAAGR